MPSAPSRFDPMLAVPEAYMDGELDVRRRRRTWRSCGSRSRIIGSAGIDTAWTKATR
jgi:hypothetical protein